MKYFGTMKNESGVLSIGGVSVQELAATYGTPLFIYDQALIEEQCRLFTTSFQGETIRGEIAYASKAFICTAMARLIASFGMSTDVASEGELYTVYKAGFDMNKVYFHGNNKLPHEIQLAIDLGCGHVIIDHRQEVEQWVAALRGTGKTMNVYLRLNPGIEAHTHEYIKTAKNDSKFGESIYDENIFAIIETIAQAPELNLLGFHCHIGSQIFGADSFIKAADEFLDFYQAVQKKLGLQLKAMNLGGGFGVYYTEGDQPLELGAYLRTLMQHIEAVNAELGLGLETVVLEPGRSIVCNAGSTLYTVGGTKQTFGGRRYIYVDGGMSDNIRPALYQAEYEACLANRLDDEIEDQFWIAGKLCESGDILIKDIALPQAQRNDLLLVSNTGAYCYTMSMNYNRLPRPAVVFVKDGESRLVLRGQSLDDLVLLDIDA